MERLLKCGRFQKKGILTEVNTKWKLKALRRTKYIRNEEGKSKQ